jgi:NAD/NADP transhydrogenase beta subunit
MSPRVRRSVPDNGPIPSHRGRSALVLTRLIVVLGLLEVILLASDNHSVVIYYVGLLSVSVVPGWALVSPVRHLDPPLRWALVLALSWASLLLVAQVALTLHHWHPRLLVALVMLLSSGVLVVRDPLVRGKSRA